MARVARGVALATGGPHLSTKRSAADTSSIPGRGSAGRRAPLASAGGPVFNTSSGQKGDDVYGTPHAVAQRWLRTSLAGYRDKYDATVVDGNAALAAFRASREALGFSLAKGRAKGNVVACLLVPIQ